MKVAVRLCQTCPATQCTEPLLLKTWSDFNLCSFFCSMLYSYCLPSLAEYFRASLHASLCGFSPTLKNIGIRSTDFKAFLFRVLIESMWSCKWCFCFFLPCVYWIAHMNTSFGVFGFYAMREHQTAFLSIASPWIPFLLLWSAVHSVFLGTISTCRMMRGSPASVSKASGATRPFVCTPPTLLRKWQTTW